MKMLLLLLHVPQGMKALRTLGNAHLRVVDNPWIRHRLPVAHVLLVTSMSDLLGSRSAHL